MQDLLSLRAGLTHDSVSMQRQSMIQVIILATFLQHWTDTMKSTASTLPRRLLLLGSPRTHGNADNNIITQNLMWPAATGLEVGREGGDSIASHCDLRLTCTESVGILS